MTLNVSDYLHPRYKDLASGQSLEWFHEVTLRSQSELVLAFANAHALLLSQRMWQAFRWTSLDIRWGICTTTRQLTLFGNVLLRKHVDLLLSPIRQLVGRGWTVSNGAVVSTTTSQWFGLRKKVTTLWREWPGAYSTPTLSCELLDTDGPVQMLRDTSHGTLIKAADGSIGWIEKGELRACHHRSVDELTTVREFLEKYRGASYRSGGTTTSGIDCSGLLQRIFREVRGVVIPKHSKDQMIYLGTAHPRNCFLRECAHSACEAKGKRTKMASFASKALFVTSEHGTVHTGFVIDSSGEAFVLHASSTRGRVICEHFDEFAEAAASQ